MECDIGCEDGYFCEYYNEETKRAVIIQMFVMSIKRKRDYKYMEVEISQTYVDMHEY